MSDDPFPDPDRTNGPIDAQFEPAPAGPVKSARPGPGWTALGAATVIAALTGAAAGIFGADLIRPRTDIERLDARLDQMDAVQSAIDQKLSEPAAASAELAGLIGELDTVSRRLDQAIAAGGNPEAIATLTARIDALEGRAPILPLAAAGADVSVLTNRLASLEAASREAERKSAAAARLNDNRAEAALALSAIEAAVRRGASFEADYRALRSAAPDNGTIKRLAPYITGVAALTRLQSEFVSVRTAVLAAETPEKGAGRLSWIDKAFGDAVSVRPADGKHAALVKSLDTAAAALSASNLDGSVRALDSLDGAAARAAEDWIRRAERRITLEAALEDVRLSLSDGATDTR